MNLFNAWRARHYLTTYCGLNRPWHLLKPHLDGFNIEAHDHLGSSYRAHGMVSGFDNQVLTRTPAPPG